MPNTCPRRRRRRNGQSRFVNRCVSPVQLPGSRIWTSILFVFVLLTVAGCHAPAQVTHTLGPECIETDASQPVPCPTEQPCPQIVKPHITVNLPKEICVKEEPKPEQQAEAKGEPDKKEFATVAQETILVPRMVYVPYAPQVPVAPARMVQVNGAAVGVRSQMLCPPQQQQSAADAAATSAQVSPEQFLRLTRVVDALATQVSRLQQTQTVQPQAPSCAIPGAPN